MVHPIHVLPVRGRAAVINRVLAQRLETVLPAAMAASGIDMWLILCYEDNLDPVFTTLIPMDTWCPILQVIVFYDRGPGPDGVHRIERINISGTNTHDLYDRPYRGQLESEQWPLLLRVIEERDPQRIGVNIGPVQWAAGGLTHNLYGQLTSRLPAKYVARLVSAEPLATAWLSTLSEEELTLYEHVAEVAHAIIARCYSSAALIPGVTTAADLEWAYWQTSADLGLELAFKPFFTRVRSNAARELYGPDDMIIRPGDLVHCDVGIKYLRLNSDHQEWAYILRPGESAAPAGLAALLAEGNRLQDIFMAEFVHGLTGDQLLAKILARARREGIPNPRVYSHSLGLYLHEPGPLIGLPWEQERNPGRGDVALDYNNAFTMELSVSGPIPEWDGQEVRLSMEQDVVFTRAGCRLIDGRQTAFHLI
ncbi:MAG: Metallopeptidase family M24 [Chloroflexi bacterium ADurb.Bin325]|nr:MAG: Metallopeptidase family M24 [Chloroflexi bacterium ADurb.Bin325]